MLFYDCPEAYDLFYNENYRNATKDFFKILFKNKPVKSILDCTAGTGQTAIPLTQLGYDLTLSDINKNMLKKAKVNFAEAELMANFVNSDVLNISNKIKRKFDVVMSSGNSLAHIKNVDLTAAIGQMDSVLNSGGYIYFDSRNWDLILKRKQRFYLFNPIIRDKGRVNYIQVWDYNRDGSMTFNFLIFEEIENKIVSKRQFYVIYHPFTVDFISSILRDTYHYQDIKIFKMGNPRDTDISESNWYSVFARKPFNEELENLKK